jgi:hypothetical protein
MQENKSACFLLIQASLLRLLLRQQAAPSVGFLSGL